jgi:hypothetical protein
MDPPMATWIALASRTLRLASVAAVLATAAKLEGGPATTARCDQVVAMLRDSDSWLTENPCPDPAFDQGLHFYFTSISSLIARRELNPERAIDLATLEEVVELSGDFLAWLNDQLEEPLP